MVQRKENMKIIDFILWLMVEHSCLSLFVLMCIVQNDVVSGCVLSYILLRAVYRLLKTSVEIDGGSDYEFR